MFVLTTVENLVVGDRFRAPLGERIIVSIFPTSHPDGFTEYAVGQDDGPVLRLRENTPVEVFREECT